MLFLHVSLLSAPTQTVYFTARRYENLKNIDKINHAYANNLAHSNHDRSTLMYSLAYAKCIIELSHFDQAYAVLNSIRPQIKQADTYLQGCYQLVLARLLSKVGRTDEAIEKNQLAIQQLKKTPFLNELKNAYINHGYYLVSNKKFELAITYLNHALNLEKRGINEMAAVLRTNRAYISLLQNNAKDALKWCTLAEKCVDLTNPTSYLDQYRIAIIRASIAEITKDFKAEDFYLLEAERIATQHNLPDLLKKIFYSKSFNASQKGNYKEAHLLMIKVDSLNKLLPENLISERLAVLDLEDKIEEERKTVKLTNEKLALKSQQQTLLLMLLLIVSLGLFGISYLFINIKRKRDILVKQNIELAKKEELRTSKSAEHQKNVDLELIIELEKLMFDKKLYTSSQLTIEKLAKKLNTNRTYLSEAINLHYQKNYSNWIASIRMNAARKLLIDPNFNHYSIEGISKHVGFSSISSFNTLFKKFTGLTPSQFKKECFRIEY